MTKEEIKALVREVIVDMSNTYGIATEMTGVGNATGNVAGFEGPLSKKLQKRKLKDFEFTEEED